MGAGQSWYGQSGRESIWRSGRRIGIKLAERGGFEPPIPVKVCPLSRRIVSTAHAPLRVGQLVDLCRFLPGNCTFFSRGGAHLTCRSAIACHRTKFLTTNDLPLDDF